MDLAAEGDPLGRSVRRPGGRSRAGEVAQLLTGGRERRRVNHTNSRFLERKTISKSESLRPDPEPLKLQLTDWRHVVNNFNSIAVNVLT
jgi:hypothetical protein